MNGDMEKKRDIKNHLLFEVATEVANRGTGKRPAVQGGGMC
jgi:hypothetical protein